jgi:adenylate cyclase
MQDMRAIVDGLVDGARSAATSEAVLAELCRRLGEAGVPLWRVAVFVTTLHPEIMGRRFLWRAETGVAVSDAPFDILETEDFRTSPFAVIRATRKPLRRRLADPDCPDDFAVAREQRAEGATDYLAFPLFFSDGTIHVVTWTTRQPGGFSADQLAAIKSVVTPLARVAEDRALRRTAGNLLDTYVGNHAGERILAGKIRRGHVEAIGAAIWLSDMRGFTALSERLAPQNLVNLLNRYFDCQVPEIAAHGGEVLKFMGDGLLAIFPLPEDGSPAATCRRVLTAARAAEVHIAALPDGIGCGIALHIGQVMYGNIGGGNRLDFTCIGQAVNLAARLEKIAGRLGRTIVASAEFAAQVPRAFAPLGDFPVAGLAASQSVYGLKD